MICCSCQQDGKMVVTFEKFYLNALCRWHGSTLITCRRQEKNSNPPNLKLQGEIMSSKPKTLNVTEQHQLPDPKIVHFIFDVDPGTYHLHRPTTQYWATYDPQKCTCPICLLILRASRKWQPGNALSNL